MLSVTLFGNDRYFLKGCVQIRLMQRSSVAVLQYCIYMPIKNLEVRNFLYKSAFQAI